MRKSYAFFLLVAVALNSCTQPTSPNNQSTNLSVTSPPLEYVNPLMVPILILAFQTVIPTQPSLRRGE